GNYLPTNCSPNWEPYPTYVSMPAGSYSSTISKDDANTKARNEAQRIANGRNSCVGPLMYVEINTSRWPGDGALLETVFTSLVTGEQYYMYDSHEGMPAGPYSVSLNVSFSTHQWDYDLYMCGMTTHDI